LYQTLLNQYRVEAFVASGGMGVVYRVWDLKRNVSLAMKVLHADLQEDPSIIRRFQREARALQKLAHPNIVPFYGLFQTDELTGLLQRFIDGPSLKEILREQKGQPLPLTEVFPYLKALCAALGYAHAHDVVHSDVKPGNVLVDQGGNIFLTDFGIARHAESTTTTLGIAGSPAYMAPEQIRGDPVSPATDVYALGVMLYEMLTGQRPFRGHEAGTEVAGPTTSERIRFAHLHLPAPNPCHITPAIPEPLAQIVLMALSKDPEARYQTAQAMFLAVCSAVGIAAQSVKERTVTPAQFLPSAPPIEKPAMVTSSRERKSTIGIWAVILGSVAIVLFLIVALGNLRGAPAAIPIAATTTNLSETEVPTESLFVAQNGTVPATLGASTQKSLALTQAPIFTLAAQTVEAELTWIAMTTDEGPTPFAPPTLTGTATPALEVVFSTSEIGRSAGGRPISMSSIGYPGETAIVVVGSIDGTQTDTQAAINSLITRLTQQPNLIPRATTFYLIPTINPDGNQNGSRYNQNNVDLNRNWSTENWRSDPPVPGAPDGRAGAGGPYPNSEPETKALETLLRNLMVAKANVYLVIFHSTVRRDQGEIFSGYTSQALHLPSESISQLLVPLLGYRYSTEWDYATPGEVINWAPDQGIAAIDIVWPRDAAPDASLLIEALSLLSS
jgi:serine/threonine protein kinase